MLHAFLKSFSVHTKPLMTRRSFALERAASMTLPITFAMLEGGVTGVLAKKVFFVSDLAFATILAAPMLSNVLSFMWARLARGRRKIPFITGLMVASLLAAAAIAALPTDGAPGDPASSQWMLVGLILLSRCLLTGIITLRSTVWRHNYGRAVRAQITSRFLLLASLGMSISPLLGYLALDYNPQAFRVIYPLAAAISSIGVIAFAKIRLRREAELLRFERAPAAKPTRHGEQGSIYEYDNTDDVQSSDTFWSVLKKDRFFRSYMVWQFVLGSSNLVAEVAAIKLIVDLSTGVRGEYFQSILLTTAIPMLVAAATVPLWARYLDRVHIAKFRTRHVPVFLVAQSLCYVAAATGLLWLFFPARIAIGVARGGGMLAWSLGHNDFADRKLVAIYMGIHVTLTGIRGGAAPYVAVVLLAGWPSGITWLPAFSGLGEHIFAITLITCVISLAGFYALHRQVHRGKSEIETADERG